METQPLNPAPIIEAHYVGATDYKPSRIIARNVTSGLRVTMSYDAAQDACGNHGTGHEAFAVVAAAVIAKRADADGPAWRLASYASANGGGYLFACVPAARTSVSK